MSKANKRQGAKQHRKRGSRRRAGKKAFTVAMAGWRVIRLVRKLRGVKRHRRQQSSSRKPGAGKRLRKCNGKSKSKRARGLNALSVGSIAMGSFALGASAFGALAVGAVAIRRLAIKRAALGRLDVRKVKLGRLEVDELIVHSHSGPSSTPPSTQA